MAIEIASSQTREERAERAVRADVTWALRDLASNILRVAAGAGRPSSVTEHVIGALKAMQDYYDRTGRFPDAQIIADALDYEDDPPSHSSPHAELAYAERHVVQQSLRVAASLMVGQRTQATVATHGMYDGINRIVAEREAMRAQMRREEATQRAFILAASKKTSKRRKP